MSLFDSASLVVTPNGIKEDKLYSIKPTDGSGDLVVTRATTATRVNSDGLIEVTPYNLLQRSEQFDNAYWGKANMVINANATAAPNGTTTADKATASFYPSTSIFSSQIVIAANHTLSCYVKADTLSSFRMEFVSSGYAAGTTCIYNLTTQATTITNYGSTTGSTATITSVGNGWFRCTLTVLSTATTYFTQLFPAGNGSLFLWGAQLVTGTSAKEYFPTTDRLDIPRLDYTNSTCPSILVEPQRTNLLLRSEEFDNASWTKFNTTVTANQSISPNGITTADKIIPSSTFSFKEIYNYSTLTSGIVYTQTFYAKADGYRYIQILSPSVNIGNMYANFDLQTATKTDGTSGYGSIQFVGNGWCKITATFTQLVTGIGHIAISVIPNANSPRVTSWTANGTDGILVWGAQLEQGSYATSYIPTVASTVTRNADVISKTGISSLIGQTEGTIFIDANITTKSNTRVLLDIQDGTNNDVFQFVLYGNDFVCNIFDNGSLQAALSGGTLIGRKKIALGYKANDFVLYVNGVQLSTDISGTVPTASLMALGYLYIAGGYELGDTINSSALWKTRLSNTELATLTTI